jgi:hypothetical protein
MYVKIQWLEEQFSVGCVLRFFSLSLSLFKKLLLLFYYYCFFDILGDLGQTYNSLSTLEHYMQSGGQTVLYVGDLSYADRYEYNNVGIRWDSWGRFIERSSAYQPWIWSAGNHEIEYMPRMVLLQNRTL